MSKLKLVFHAPQPKPQPRSSATITLICLSCQKAFEKDIGYYNYAMKRGLDRFFCSKSCHHESRRAHKPVDLKKAEKSAYDKEYRAKNYEKRRAQGKAWFQRTYDPVKAAVERKAKMPRHVAYCRRPEYKKWKHDYDQQHVAKKKYGEYWESYLLTKQIQAEYDDDEVRQANDLHNKSIKRKRAWHKLQNSQQVL